MEQPTVKMNPTSPKLCQSNAKVTDESYDTNFLKIVHMQKYGILYYNTNANSAIFSLSLLNVNIFKKKIKPWGHQD